MNTAPILFIDRSRLNINKGSRRETIHSGPKNDGREKEADPRRFRRCIDDRRRRYIYRFPVDRLPIITFAVIIIAAAVIPAPSVLGTAIIMSFDTSSVIATGRSRAYTADHCGQHKPQHNPAHKGSEIPYL